MTTTTKTKNMKKRKKTKMVDVSEKTFRTEAERDAIAKQLVEIAMNNRKINNCLDAWSKL